jgi:hypothetical protein
MKLNEKKVEQEAPPALFPAVDWDKLRTRLKIVWARAFWPLLFLLIGLGLGENITEKRIVDDCRFSSNFRVGHQAFTCQRRL